jgi:hypothetical protein
MTQFQRLEGGLPTAPPQFNTAWVNGIVPTSAAFPLHPDQLGEQNMANQVLSVL